MKIMKTATVLGTVALSLALAACGSEKSQAPSGPAPTSSTGVDDKLAAMVPAAIKADGKIVIGTDSTYAPSEFLDTDGKTVIGFDVDLFNAVAKKLGLTTEWQSGDFGSLIAGVASGKYETSVSSFTVNADREKNANMVSYFSAGTQWAAPTGKTVDPNNACGLKVAVQTNTVQVDDLTMKSKACTAAGKKPITIEQFQDQGAATAAVASGKTDAMSPAYPQQIQDNTPSPFVLMTKPSALLSPIIPVEQPLLSPLCLFFPTVALHQQCSLLWSQTDRPQQPC